MNQTFEDYCREVDKQAEKLVSTDELEYRDDHLRAFNFGRLVQRTERSRFESWIRIACLLGGLAIGVVCGRVNPQHVYPVLAHKFIAK